MLSEREVKNALQIRWALCLFRTDYLVMADIAIAHMVMAYVVMAYVVMASNVMALVGSERTILRTACSD